MLKSGISDMIPEKKRCIGNDEFNKYRPASYIFSLLLDFVSWMYLSPVLNWRLSWGFIEGLIKVIQGFNGLCEPTFCFQSFRLILPPGSLN